LERSNKIKVTVSPFFFQIYRKLKEKRQRLQKENTRKKAQKMEEMRQKSLKGMQKRPENQLGVERMQAEVEQDAGSDEDDNDAEWYRKEVGHDPETGKHSEIETFHF